MRRVDTLAAAALIGLTALLLPPAYLWANEAMERANRTRCANNLRQLGLAAIQYADDKRFYPHAGPIRELDGGIDTPHTPTCVRTLVWAAYHDAPEGFVCPSSDDVSAPIGAEAPSNMRRWTWRGTDGEPSPDRSPVQTGGDPVLAETTELSYGYTRRGLNVNVRSTARIWADRKVRDGSTGALAGNHDGGWNLGQADAAVTWLAVDADPFPGGYLAKTAGRTDGFLAVADQDDPSAFAGERAASDGVPTPWADRFDAAEAGLRVELHPRAWSGRAGSWGVGGGAERGGVIYRVAGRADPADPARVSGRLVPARGREELAFSARLDDGALVLEVAGDEPVRAEPLPPTPQEECARAFLEAVAAGEREGALDLVTAEGQALIAQVEKERGIDVFANLRRELEKSGGVSAAVVRQVAADVVETPDGWRIELR